MSRTMQLRLQLIGHKRSSKWTSLACGSRSSIRTIALDTGPASAGMSKNT